VTQEDHRDPVSVCMGGTGKAKFHLELNLVRDVKGGKKSFCRCISSKRKTGKNVRLLLNGVENLVTKDTEQAEVLSVFFPSAFTDKACF